MAQKRKRKKNWISWLIILVLFVAAGAVVYLVWDSYFRDKKDDKEDQQVEQVDKKDSDKAEEQGEEESSGKKKVVQYDGEDPNEAESLSGVVTYVGVSGDKLMIRANIDQYLDGGECRLTLSRGSAIIYSSIANVVGNASTSTCEGFDVPVSELGGGVIEININVNSGGRSGVIHGEANI